MQPVISIETIKLKKPKSATTYPKKPSTCIIAFAMNENMKTSSTKIEHETKLHNNITVTPSTSRKTLAIKCSQQNIDNILKANESKTIIKENCGDGEDRSSETLNKIQSFLKINEVTSQPQVIFVAQKHVRKSKFETETSDRMQKKCKPVVIIKNIHFKNQCPRNLTRKLKKYYSKSKKKSDGYRGIHKDLDSESISMKISRTRILKKVLATENFLADQETNKYSSADITSQSDGDNSFISISSQDTLKQEDSLYSANSVIEVRDSKTKSFNTNVINVAVAHINNTPNLSRESYSILVPHKVKTDIKHNLISDESAFSQTCILTFNSFINDAIKLTSKTTISNASCSNISNETLTPPKTRSGISHDDFEINNSLGSPATNNMFPCYTPRCNFATQSQDYGSLTDCHINDVNEKDQNTQRPHSNLLSDFPKDNKVIIAEDIFKTAQQKQKMRSRGDERFQNVENDFRANIFQKPLNVVDTEDYHKNLALPNAAQIKCTMFDSSRTQRKYSQEENNYPTNFPELCEKLTVTLEIAVKKLEQTLSERIVNELKRSLYEIDKRLFSRTKLPGDTTSEIINNDIQLENPFKSKETSQTAPYTDVNLQCNIIQNDIIDKLLLTFNDEYSQSCIESSSSNYTHKLKKPKLVKNYFDILKNTLSSEYKNPETVNGDSVQISIEDSTEEKKAQFGLKKTFWSIPITILRENMLVVASVPAFLFVMFVLYSYILLLIRMWWY